MNDLAEIQALPSSPSTRPYSQWFEPFENLGISLIDHLYNRLDGAYPHKWRSNFPDEQAIDNWAESWVEAFEEEGITPQDVKVGLRECRRRYGWPPSVAEFIQACRPTLDPMKAYYEAVAGLEARGKSEFGTWSHPAIFWAAWSMRKELREQTFSAVRPRWETVLRQQLDKDNLDPIPEPVFELTAPGQSLTTCEKAKALIGNLVGNVINRQLPADRLRWARQILDRAAAGEKLTPTTVQMARDALAAEA